MNEKIVSILKCYFSELQAVYLFGSHGTEYEQPGSDVDIAVLLPSAVAAQTTADNLLDCTTELSSALGKDVDLINLRHANTVFQHEIIFNATLLYVADQYAVDMFEMITMSLYQKLNEERAEILADFINTGRAYSV